MGADELDLTEGRGGVYKKTLRDAPVGEQGPPPSGSNVTVHYEGWLLDGQKFDSSRDREAPFTFKLGVGEVIEGWDLAVASMAPGEVASYTVRSDYAYGWEGKPPNIPVDATLRFEVELLSWEAAAKPVGEMKLKERQRHGLAQREEGTKLLRGGQYAEAATCFEAGVESLGSLHALMRQGRPDPKALSDVHEALRSCLLNLTQCQLKSDRWEDAVGTCTRVLSMPREGENVKALYRRGMARLELSQLDEARDDLYHAATLDPKSKEVRAAYEKAKAAHASHRADEKAAFGGKLLSLS